MENTTNGDAGSGSVATQDLGAVSQAIQQAAPPGQQRVQSPKESALPSSGQRQVTPTESKSSEKTLSLEDFGDEENPFTPKEVKPVNRVDKKVVEKVKPEVKVEEKAEEQELESEENIHEKPDDKLELNLKLNEEDDPSKLTQEQEKTKGKRDYSKFKPEHQEYLKKLPNHLFAQASENLVKLYQTEQELSQVKEKLSKVEQGKLPDNYYEHPAAFQLSPEYNNLTQELSYDDFELRHWESQLLNIEQGKAWMNLLGYDEKTKEPRFEKVEAIKNAEGDIVLDVVSKQRVAKAVTAVDKLRDQHIGKLNSLQVSHKQEFERSKQGLEGLKKQFFAPFLVPDKLPTAVKADLQLAKTTIEKDLPAFRSNPAMELLVYSYAALKAQDRQILKMAQLLNQKADKLEIDRRAGPGKNDFQGGSTKGDKILSESDFDD